MSIRYLDAHLHLQDPRFKGKVNEVIGRAKNAGVGLFFCNAIKEKIGRRSPLWLPPTGRSYLF